MSADKHLSAPEKAFWSDRSALLRAHLHQILQHTPASNIAARHLRNRTPDASSIMASSEVLVILYIVLGVALIVGIHLLFRRLTRTRRRDEEQERPARGPRFSISLETLPRRSPPSSPALLLPNAAPPAHLPRSRREGESSTPPRPLPNLPALRPESLSAKSSQRPCPPQSPALFILANDSTESFQSETSPLDQGLPPTAPKRQKRPPPIRIPFANDSTASIEVEVAGFAQPTFRRPLPLSLQPHSRPGTVQARRPVIVLQNSLDSGHAIGSAVSRFPSPVSLDPETTTGNFVSNMVKTVERDRPSPFASSREHADQGGSPPSPLMNSVMNRISSAREKWSKIDL